MARWNDNVMVSRLTDLPYFDTGQCRRVPRGREVHALKELILAGGADIVTPLVVCKAVSDLFYCTCDALQHFGDSHDDIWPIVWETGPWGQEANQYADPTALKIAVELYYDGFKGTVHAGASFPPNQELGPGLALVLTGVARWDELVQGTAYDVVIRPRARPRSGEPPRDRRRLDTSCEEEKRTAALVS